MYFNSFYAYVASFVVGVALYFGCYQEPSFQPLLLGLIGFVVFYFLLRKNALMRLIVGMCVCLQLGFFAAYFRAHSVAAPVLDQKSFYVVIRGKVVSSVQSPDRQQIILGDLDIEGVLPEKTPHFIRLSTDLEYPIFQPNDRLQVTASLFPPSLPVVPGGYDFARRLWFERIGATGYINQIQVLIPDIRNTESFFERIRKRIFVRLQEVLSYDQAQVAVPLVVGEQKVVSEEFYDLFRFAGITHVLSVSGFHLSLVAGVVFFLIRFIFSLFPGINGRMNSKKTAVLIAFCVAFFYLMISGVQVPAIRSFIMLFFVLAAVFFDRDPFSVRFAAIAGVVLLVIRPELILNIGFQLSFMAVFALLTVFKFLYRQCRLSKGFLKGVCNIIIGIILVDIVANVATLPLIAYHFNQITPYGLFGNFATTLLFSGMILPLLLIGVLFMPIGWEDFFWKIAGHGIDWVVDVCRYLADLPMASIGIPSYGTDVLILFVSGLFFIFAGYRWILIGCFCISVGGIMAVSEPRPIALANKNLLGYRDSGGQLIVSSPRSLYYPLVAEVWLQRDGQQASYMQVPNEDKLPDRISIESVDIATDLIYCQSSDIMIVSSVEEIPDCKGIVISNDDFEKDGTYAFYNTPNGISVKTSRDALGRRPWTSGFND